MSDQVERMTLLFADISNSTRIIQAHGDRVAHARIQACLDEVARAVREHAGEVRSQIGDELMCTFPTSRRAIGAALDIQERVKAGAASGLLPAEIRMHIGLHHGPVLVDADQLFGDTIHIAKRMVDLAKTDQILTTAETLQSAGPLADIRARLADEIRVKGYDQPMAIYEVMRQDPGVTLVGQRILTAPAAECYARCQLDHGGHPFTLDATRPVFSIGREAGNDLVIAESCVSRNHGRLEYQKGRIIYIDQSTNGTSILEAGALEPIFLHREQRWLRSQGALRFGRRHDETGRLTLQYRCEGSSAEAREA